MTKDGAVSLLQSIYQIFHPLLPYLIFVIFCTAPHFLACTLYATKVRKSATKIASRQTAQINIGRTCCFGWRSYCFGWRSYCFGWRSWCLLHWDGVFVTWDGAFRNWDGVSGIFKKQMWVLLLAPTGTLVVMMVYYRPPVNHAYPRAFDARASFVNDARIPAQDLRALNAHLARVRHL